MPALLLDEGLWKRAAELEDLSGLELVRERDRTRFGAGQAIIVEGSGLLGGTDARENGYATGF